MWTTPLNYTADDFRCVVAPTLVLNGDRDELVSVEEAAEMFHLLPHGELAVVPGADHGRAARGEVFESGALGRDTMLGNVGRHCGLEPAETELE